jgi:hypothetical protein
MNLVLPLRLVRNQDVDLRFPVVHLASQRKAQVATHLTALAQFLWPDEENSLKWTQRIDKNGLTE